MSALARRDTGCNAAALRHPAEHHERERERDGEPVVQPLPRHALHLADREPLPIGILELLRALGVLLLDALRVLFGVAEFLRSSGAAHFRHASGPDRRRYKGIGQREGMLTLLLGIIVIVVELPRLRRAGGAGADRGSLILVLCSIFLALGAILVLRSKPSIARELIGSAAWQGALACLIVAPSLAYRIAVEERFLTAAMGERYKEYSARTARLIQWLL